MEKTAKKILMAHFPDPELSGKIQSLVKSAIENHERPNIDLIILDVLVEMLAEKCPNCPTETLIVTLLGETKKQMSDNLNYQTCLENTVERIQNQPVLSLL
jgi:hypothetical protein